MQLGWSQTEFVTFASKNAPWLVDWHNSLVQTINALKAAASPNFYYGGRFLITEEKLEEAEKYLESLKPNEPADGNYNQGLQHLGALIGGTIQVYNESREKATQAQMDRLGFAYQLTPPEGRLLTLADADYGFPLGERYLEFRENLETFMKARADFLEALRKYVEEIGKKNAELLKKLARLEETVSQAVSKAKSALDNGDFQGVADQEPMLEGFRAEYKIIGLSSPLLDRDLAYYTAIIDRAKKYNPIVKEEDITAIKDLYEEFRSAYEQQDDIGLLSLLADDWEALDGTTLFDLEDNLRRTFRLYDEVQVSLQSLIINRVGINQFQATYDITITSRMYDRNLVHEEKSSVDEVVRVEDGKPKIIRTIQGRYWYVE
jgi:hypothetical protein